MNELFSPTGLVSRVLCTNLLNLTPFQLTRHSENRYVIWLKLSWNEAQVAVRLIAYCEAAWTSLSDSLTYVTFLFSEWRIEETMQGKLSENLNVSHLPGTLAIYAEDKKIAFGRLKHFYFFRIHHPLFPSFGVRNTPITFPTWTKCKWVPLFRILFF